MTQHIKIADAKAAARKAFEEGHLVAQQPDGSICCSYVSLSGCVCAIGAGLEPETRAEVVLLGYNARSVAALATARIISTDDMLGLINLQTAHDRWAARVAHGREDAEAQKAMFLAMIGVNE